MLKAVCNFKKSKKGFTLIELLIVVAIIAILAAIAIPQFSQYRVRGYNSAGNSDIRNIKVQTEAFGTDWQVYASSADAGALGVGSIRQGPTTWSTGALAAGAIVAGSPGLPTAAVAEGFSFGVSNGVRAAISTTAATGAQYAAATKHTSGDKAYCADSNRTDINWKDIIAGTQLQVADVPTSTSANTDCATAGFAASL